jgi:acetone carboxylase gamma subunit
MCGEQMRRVVRDQIDRVPGTRDTRSKRIAEWICPECEYFEEADDDS